MGKVAPRRQVELDELDEEDEELEEEEEEEEEAEDPNPPPPPPPPAQPPPAAAPVAAIAPPQIRRRTPKKKSEQGLGRPEVERVQWQNKEADLMWGEILQRLEADGHSPYELEFSVTALGAGINTIERDVQDGRERYRSHGGVPVLATFDCASIMGDATTSPGQALIRCVEDRVHLPYGSPTGMVYGVDFKWKANSQIIGRARLALAPRQQILAMREAAMRGDQGSPWGSAPQPGFGRPQGQPMPYPGYPPPYGQYGYPPPTPPPYQPPPFTPQAAPAPRGMDPDTRYLIEQLVAQVNEVRRENAELRNQPPPPPMQAPVVAPPAPATGVAAPAVPSMEELVEKATMRAVALLTGGKLGLGAPAQTPSSQLETELNSQAAQMVRGMTQAAFSMVKKGFERSIHAGFGAPMPEEVPAPEAPAEVVEPPKPEDSLPFAAIPLDSTWADGRKVIYPVKKDTGQIDWMGALFTNPIMAEKLADVGQQLASAVQDTLKKMTSGPNPHIVHRTPSGATDATPNPSPTEGRTGFGSGWGGDE